LTNRRRLYVVLRPTKSEQKYHELSDETHTVCGLPVSKLRDILTAPPPDATLCGHCSRIGARAAPFQK
jgi:hypothetical protein